MTTISEVGSLGAATRYLEDHARITKLPGGTWRVWLREYPIRVYGSTRSDALLAGARRMMQYKVEIKDGRESPNDRHGT